MYIYIYIYAPNNILKITEWEREREREREKLIPIFIIKTYFEYIITSMFFAEKGSAITTMTVCSSTCRIVKLLELYGNESFKGDRKLQQMDDSCYGNITYSKNSLNCSWHRSFLCDELPMYWSCLVLPLNVFTPLCLYCNCNMCTL